MTGLERLVRGLSLTLSVAFVVMLAGCSRTKLSADQQALVQAAQRAGAQDVTGAPLDDGGMRLNGELDGRAFSLAIPWRWNKQAVLFANGYSPPGTRNNIEITDNPLKGDDFGVYRIPYSQGFAVGLSAYDKAGIGVQTGIENTHRLNQFLTRFGSTRAYLIGASMGGNITEGLIERYPADFSGALAACGVVDSWPGEIGHLIDLRAAYNYFTHGTAYSLPGDQRIDHSALSTWTSPAFKSVTPLYTLMQLKRLAAPIVKLFAAAQANPTGPEQRMIDNIAAATGAEKDLGSFLQPIVTVSYGMDDIETTFGGSIYDNTAKVYSSPYLSVDETHALNRDIQRIRADPRALAYATEWHKATGKFNTKLISIYNSVDPLVPSELEESALLKAVHDSGNDPNLVQEALPPMRVPQQPFTDAKGYAHCGFTPDQIATAWGELRHWVESNQRPGGGPDAGESAGH
ncbi:MULTISPECIES: hypothetical protein [unclassified Dyella]|uniref:hypothetical protein n=1 Tax=unclassified Dyella TaxID=2634549 RepID=UPI000CCA5ADB|nr:MULTISPECIES: hypothetical protein [unclassified Dyella]MDR3447170.1 hypothetical protein [Dyella sp.]PMQ04658.1 hypothetical protein DyAD56_13350 [Dyella sp. AD56]